MISWQLFQGRESERGHDRVHDGGRANECGRANENGRVNEYGRGRGRDGREDSPEGCKACWLSRDPGL